MDSKAYKRHAEIAAFAQEYAGTEFDLDRDLEEAGIEVIEAIGALPEPDLLAVEDGIRAAIDLDS